jgi:hypothetical protein
MGLSIAPLPLAHLASKFQADVRLSRHGYVVNGKSVIDPLSFQSSPPRVGQTYPVAASTPRSVPSSCELSIMTAPTIVEE